MIIYREAETLARDLELSVRVLYAVSNDLPRHYRRVELPKGDGTARTLSVPDPLLKTIQRRITERLLVHMPLSPHATAYRYGGSPLRNAAPHAGKAMVLKLDIRHFFDSVLYSTVKDAAFPAAIYAESLRVLLTMLCYYGDALPQGAPSSPTISNLILRDFDIVVGGWCGRREIAYTRYCDDMTFSGSFDPVEITVFVARELRRNGFFLNGEKTHLARQGQRQTVTGLVVNQRPAAPALYRRALRQEVYFCQKFGVAAHLAKTGSAWTEAGYLRHLLGRVGYVLQAEPGREEARQWQEWALAELKTYQV